MGKVSEMVAMMYARHNILDTRNKAKAIMIFNRVGLKIFFIF